MAEIWNLEALCRCCHADGIFKNLNEYIVDNSVENYLNLLIETLGVSIKPPPANASFSICDACISKLRGASAFKKMVLDCETKFEEYCKNELLSNVKMEPEYLEDDDLSEITIKVPKALKNVKKEDATEVIEISIDVGPAIEKKTTKKKIRPKDKTKQIKLKKPKEEESCVVKVKTETGEVFSCRVCGITYDNLDELNVHINEEHYVGYKCSHCSEIFARENKFRLHNAEVHLDTKPFQCPHCFRKVGSKHSLTEHINSSHTKERHYQCDVCQKIFHNKHVLRIHLRKHDGTFTKLICDQCGVCSNDKSNLKTHIQTVHEKVRKYECEVCGKKFSAAKHVRVHMRSHTGERPFACDNCDKKYPTREALKAHQKLHDNSAWAALFTRQEAWRFRIIRSELMCQESLKDCPQSIGIKDGRM
ncbi:hypothetical protein MSG28_015385 [Choristoneura fumiferana]|uniref:Uncharacterized protein n=1 Tax=Choristoneura fumiferana TaxID=7141 RepID=A0ACC0KAV9_CHOFU|nr:hypothetical protein MSG28_015385 [Choristoneura fumiferana]